MKPIILIPEQVAFKINTTYLSVQLEERESLPILFEAQQLNERSKLEVLKGNCLYTDLSRVIIRLVFPIFAEVNYKMVNFFEWEYGNFQIKNAYFDLDKRKDNAYFFNFWANQGIHPDPGFYQVHESPWLQKNVKRYDPNDRFNLRHYIVTGYDSHIEFIASENYTVEVTDIGF